MVRKIKKLQRGVSIVGAGMSQFGSFKDLIGRDLLSESFRDLVNSVDKGLDVMDIQSLYIGNFSTEMFEGQGHIGPIMADWLGLPPRPATRVENACASGGSALREGINAVASGLYDIVLVGGVEKMSSLSTEETTDVLAMAADVLYEVPAGFTFPAIYAAIAVAYLDKFEVSPEQLFEVSIKNHMNGALNPRAQFNSTISEMMERRVSRMVPSPVKNPWNDEREFLNDLSVNPWVSWPLRLFDCAPITDGSACVLLVADEICNFFTDKPVRIIGTGQATGPQLNTAPNTTSLSAARVASLEAYSMAGIGPDGIQIAEVHDCFSIAEVVATEDLGFFKEGEGIEAVKDGRTSLQGEKPINTSGGLKAKGHPVGASGVAQVVELYLQLRRQAGLRQVANPNLEFGLAHNIGAAGGTGVVHILQRE